MQLGCIRGALALVTVGYEGRHELRYPRFPKGL
jgi:hypothetical protein